MGREVLTTGHIVAGQINKRASGGCAIHRHADAGRISLALIVDEKGRKESVSSNGLEAGNGQKEGAEAHFEKVGSGSVLRVWVWR